MIKQIADPVLGTVKIEDELIAKLLNTKEFRRLNNVSQLGLTSFLYPSATHTRLSHSLGTYELTRRLLMRLKDVDDELSLSLMIAALLHDLGHGPMSHLFELIHDVSHEEYTIMLIEDDESEISKILDEYPRIKENVINIINKTHKEKFANQIISSQVDVDRLDYLLRDSYFCGTSYGINNYE
jgi:HD superfamily phosphohydrolase